MAVFAVLAFFVTSVAVDVFFARSWFTGLAVLLFYYLINLSYSFGLKRIPIADVSIIAFGFLLRVLYGGIFGGISVSPWLFLTVISLSFYFALGKRRGELRHVGFKSRASLEHYPPAFLSSNMHIFLGCGIVFYSLWAANQAELHTASSPFYFASIAIVMLICMRYSFLIESNSSEGDPVSVVFSDKALIACVAVWAICLLFPLYGGLGA